MVCDKDIVIAGEPKVKAGDKLPAANVTFLNDWDTTKVSDISEPMNDKKVVLFGGLGAFQEVCSRQLRGYIRMHNKIKEAGVDMIACVCVNDPNVMLGWREENCAHGKVQMISDGNAEFASQCGNLIDLSDDYMGFRGNRFVMVIENNIVKYVAFDELAVLNHTSALSVCQDYLFK